MAKFYGQVGYAESVETVPGVSGVWEDVITERNYYGDVIRNARYLKEPEGDRLNKDITLQNSISIVADAFAYEHFFAIRYVVWMGVRWTVTDVEVQPSNPRLQLRVGGVYRGQTPTVAETP